MSSLCSDFIHRAIQTWSIIHDSESTGIGVSEETITDINLLELQKRHPNEIKTQKFSKPREATIGADWEWWLGSGGYWLGLRIQAKKLSSADMRYSHLDHKTAHGRQIELLIDKALTNNPPMIPLYIFYNWWNVREFDPPWLCRTYDKMIDMLGCGMVEARSVKSTLDNGSDKLQDIADKMYPWSCLVCCKGFSRGYELLPYRACDFFDGAYRGYVENEDLPYYESEKFVSRGAPSYVTKILEGARLSEDEWQKIKVNRVTVLYEKVREV